MRLGSDGSRELIAWWSCGSTPEAARTTSRPVQSKQGVAGAEKTVVDGEARHVGRNPLVYRSVLVRRSHTLVR
jgi:hypothetical protein